MEWLVRKIVVKSQRFSWWLLNYPLVDFEDEPDTVVVVALGAADSVWMGLVCHDRFTF